MVLGGALLAACGPSGPSDLPAEGMGRVVARWTLDGVGFTDRICADLKIQYMEVEVRGERGGDRISFTEVSCALDRFPLQGTPLGRVQLRVGAFGKGLLGAICMTHYGEAITEAKTTDPAAPTVVALKATGACPK
jgi:hypothetical protein